MKKLIFTLIVLISGCDSEPYTAEMDLTDCSGLADKVSEFILACAKAANPMADEEGEDLVRQCQITGEQVLCPKRRYIVTKGCGTCSELYRELKK
jgi:hypothetical protein